MKIYLSSETEYHGLTKYPIFNVTLYYFCTFLLYLSYNYKRNVQMNIYNIFICIFISLYIIDFVGACIHYCLDKYSGNNKYIQPIAIEFQTHHDEPFKLIKCSNFSLLHQISTLWFLPFLCFVLHIYLKYINITHNIIQSIIIIEILINNHHFEFTQ